ncbi:MAG: AAA family ATPase [Actinomycetota bacterium]
MITRLELTNFSVFKHLAIDFSPKINVIIGENGTGKTQLMKAAYALLSGSSLFKAKPEADEDNLSAFLTTKLVRLCMPLEDKLGKLHHTGASEKSEIKAQLDLDRELRISFHNNSRAVAIQNNVQYERYTHSPVFIPTKEVLSFMKGFNSLYERYELSFDQTYQDLCLLLDLPEIRPETLQEKSKWAMEEIEKICRGKFIFYGGGNVTFKSSNTEYSANSIAEGFRKLGILSRLLETGAIQPGVSGPLFWDEPESNMNPKLMRIIVEILIELSRNGQQIILTTHDYVLLKCFDQLVDKGKGDHIRFHSLYLNHNNGEIRVSSVDDYLSISPNPIDDAFGQLIDQEIENSMGDLGK